MTAYLDSSAAVKLLLDDEGVDHDLRIGIDAMGPLTTSRLTYVEIRAALAAARRSGRLRGADYDPAISEFEATWRTFEVIDLSPSLAKDAGEVADTFGLRAGDAIQFATLRSIGLPDLPIVAWDVRLRAAAQASGFPCYPVEV